MAAQEGKVDVVRLLTEAEAHVNMQTEVYACTCICMYKECCCYYIVSGHVHVYGRFCALLALDECHVVSWSDKCTYIQDGETALYIASQEGHGPVVELLLQTEHTDVNISRKVYDTNTIAYISTGSVHD